jgi:translation initiation factor IF-3
LHDADPNLVRNLNYIPEQIRLVDLDRTWIASRNEVQTRIRETQMDLYLVNKEVNPPVYKIMDYGRYKFDLQKKHREQKRKQREQTRLIKEFKFKPGCSDHDIGVKVHHIRENLPDHDIKICMDLKKTAFVLTMRRTRNLYEVVADENFVLNKVLVELQDVIQPTKLSVSENQISAILKPCL